MTAQERRGQAKVIAHVRGLVDAWRGFPLGAAGDPSPVEPPRYEPVHDGDHAITATTRALLTHWFRREPHLLGRSASAFKYWPHQRRAVETFIYLYEVRGIRRTEGLFALAEEEALQPQHDPWTKLGAQLATGAGKTKVMSLIIAWAYLNATQEPETPFGFGRHTLLIAPGLFVRDRLLADFLPPDGRPSIFWSDPILPPELERSWDLKVYSSDTCPLHLDPREGALVVTNYQQLLRTRDESPDLSQLSPEERQLELLFAAGDPSKLEAVASPLIDRFARSRGLLVLNDEAHRVWDEPGHAWFEKKAKEKAKISAEEVNTQMGWIRCLRRLHASPHSDGRLALQIDLSATLFQETGSLRKVGDTATLRDQELFRHTACTYDLSEAIRDGIVKKPILERVVVRDKQTGEPQPLIRPGQPNAWETYRNLLTAGIERWKKVRDQLIDEGDPRKPILFLLCNDRNEALEIANALRFGDPRRVDLSAQIPTGWPDPQTGEPLFLETGADGVVRTTVVEIHIGKKEEGNEEEWKKIRAAVNAIDHDEIVDPDPNAPRDELGQPRKIPNPYNVVVSVMMLREGWDVRNVKVIVPTRPCDSRTLTEQALGRGLRKMHAPELDEDGAALLLPEELYVMEHPSFRAIIEQIDDLVEQKDSDDIDAVREYVPIEPKEDTDARERVDVRLVNYEGMQEVRRQWHEAFSLARVTSVGPRIAWKEELGESEIQTFLQKALEKIEAEGQLFTLPSDPSYRDFAHVLDHAYVIPLLKDLRASFQHKLAVRTIVQSYLEQKTFALPMGVPIALDRAIEAGNARLVIGNLARPEVIGRVKKALLPALREAFTAERPSERAVLSEQIASHLGKYQAIKRCVLNAPVKSVFKRAAMDSAEEERVARMLDGAADVTGWVFNHRSGVGYAIPYEFRGLTGRYFPDFVARAQLGEVMHNFIIEVKGRLDDRDKAKAERGRQYCDLLTAHDTEPWHYLMIIENPQSGRADVTWWEQQSVRELGHLLRRHETLPLFPDGETTPAREVLQVLPNVSEDRKY
ncbi:MAG: DEAD/DEAH box helicase family protein, partial [Byssovorax sp.]